MFHPRKRSRGSKRRIQLFFRRLGDFFSPFADGLPPGFYRRKGSDIGWHRRRGGHCCLLLGFLWRQGFSTRNR